MSKNNCSFSGCNNLVIKDNQYHWSLNFFCNFHKESLFKIWYDISSSYPDNLNRFKKELMKKNSNINYRPSYFPKYAFEATGFVGYEYYESREYFVQMRKELLNKMDERILYTFEPKIPKLSPDRLEIYWKQHDEP